MSIPEAGGSEKPIFNPDEDKPALAESKTPAPVKEKKVSLGDRILKVVGFGKKTTKENVPPAAGQSVEEKGLELQTTAKEAALRSKSRRSLGFTRRTLRGVEASATTATAAAAPAAAPAIGDTAKMAQVAILLSYLKAKNAHLEEGIFRQSAQKEVTAEVKSRLDANAGSPETVDLSNLRGYDAAVLMKQIIGEMKMSAEFRQAFRDFGKELKTSSDMTPEQQIAGLNRTLSMLTPEQRSTLKSVVEFCTTVAANSATNKMTADNLGICFGPNFDVEGIEKTNPTELMRNPTAPNESFAGLVKHFANLKWD